LERLFLYPYLYTAFLKTFDLVRAFMIYLCKFRGVVAPTTLQPTR
jgi:hypothetical protein